MSGLRARGRCPGCGRVVAGRAYGIQRRAADKPFVILAAHRRPGGVCLPRGSWQVVDRVQDLGVAP